MPVRRAAILIALLLIAAAPPRAAAAWLPSGVAIAPCCSDAWDPGVALDGAGGVYAITGTGRSITRLRHFTSGGDDAPGWSPSGFPLNATWSYARTARLAPDGGGGVFGAFLASGCVNSCSQF